MCPIITNVVIVIIIYAANFKSIFFITFNFSLLYKSLTHYIDTIYLYAIMNILINGNKTFPLD
jgi:hypothetical protein